MLCFLNLQKREIYKKNSYNYIVYVHKYKTVCIVSSSDFVFFKFQSPYNSEEDIEVPPIYRDFLKNCFTYEHKARWTIEEACKYLEERGMFFKSYFLSLTTQTWCFILAEIQADGEE